MCLIYQFIFKKSLRRKVIIIKGVLIILFWGCTVLWLRSNLGQLYVRQTPYLLYCSSAPRLLFKKKKGWEGSNYSFLCSFFEESQGQKYECWNFKYPQRYLGKDYEGLCWVLEFQCSSKVGCRITSHFRVYSRHR